MTPVFQSKRGLGGDCLAACLATIFNEPLASMPDLAPPACLTDWTLQPRMRRTWLLTRGFDYLEVDTRVSFTWTQGAVPGGPCLFAVESGTPAVRDAGCGHFVVGVLRELDDRVDHVVLHDPLGTVRGDYKITAVGFFVRR